MKDDFGRNITYMRVSLTERCNLRCRYCMGEEGIVKKSKELMLKREELITAIKVAAKLGICKIRLTGGEPLVKKDIYDIISDIKKIDDIKELCITTNGILLPTMAKTLYDLGVDRLNISLDTLNEGKYRYITRCGNLNDAISGIEKSLEVGFKKIKINTVLIGGFNDDEIRDLVELTLKYPIDMRFIELMPMTEKDFFGDEAYISCDKVLEKVPDLKAINIDGVARIYTLENAKGRVGLISPVSNLFCKDCNRIRLTADGFIKPCLHSRDELNIKGKTEEEMEEIFKKAIMMKPEKHNTLSHSDRSMANRDMNRIGG